MSVMGIIASKPRAVNGAAEREVARMDGRTGHSRVLRLCVAAVMAVLVLVASDLQIQIPSVLGMNRFHLGNSMCALSGLLLGPWWGGLAAGIGSALFDLTNPAYVMDAPITFLTKGIYGLVAGGMYVRLFRRGGGYAARLASTATAAVTYLVLYLAKKFFLDGMVLAGLNATAAWAAVIEAAPSSLFNAVVAVAIAPLLGAAVQRALKAAHLEQVLV